MAARILRAATVVEALSAKWNLTIVVGSLRLSGKNRLQAADLVFEALRSEKHLSPVPLLCRLARADYCESRNWLLD